MHFPTCNFYITDAINACKSIVYVFCIAALTWGVERDTVGDHNSIIRDSVGRGVGDKSTKVMWLIICLAQVLDPTAFRCPSQ